MGFCDGAEAGDHGRVEAVGFLQDAQAFRKAADLARVDHRAGDLVQPQEGMNEPLVAAGGLQHHQLDLVLATEAGQIGDALRAARDAPVSLGLGHAGVEKLA